MFIKVHIFAQKRSFLLTQSIQRRLPRLRAVQSHSLLTWVITGQHSPAHPTTKPLKPLCQFLSAWENYSENSGYAPQFRCRPPCFNGVVQSLTLPRNALVLRQELCNLLEKGVIERIPASELESSFYSRYFVVAKRDGGLRSILDLRPINRALCKRPFRMISLEQILAQIRPGDWLRPWI